MVGRLRVAPLFRGESCGVHWHSARVFERLKVFEVTLPEEIVRQSPLPFLGDELGSPLEEKTKLLDEQKKRSMVGSDLREEIASVTCFSEKVRM